MAGNRGLYRIWIANLSASDSNNRWSAATRLDTADLLRGLFRRVIADPACPFSAAEWFLFEPTSRVAAEELLIYILPSFRQSIINRQGGAQINPDRPGNTLATGNGVISELYLGPGPRNPSNSALGDTNHTQLIANLAFHELMHNKLDALPVGSGGAIDDIHAHGGGGLATGNAITSSTTASPANIQLMARNLARPVPQFTQGVTNLVISQGMPTMIDGHPAPSP